MLSRPPFLNIWQVQPSPPNRKQGWTLCNCLTLTRNTLSTLLHKVMHFQRKTNFFFQHIAGRFWFCFFDVFLWALFHSSAIMKLKIALYLHISLAPHLTSHQIVWHNKRINGHGLKITSYCCFFIFQGNKVRDWYYLYNFKLLVSFRKCK